jgi:hypothetical protein
VAVNDREHVLDHQAMPKIARVQQLRGHQA